VPKEAAMKKERLTHFRKKLEEKYHLLVAEVGKNALYGKGPEDDSIKDLGDQATSAYNREFLFELGNGDRRLLKEVVSALQKISEGGFGDCERCGEAIAEKRLEALPFARYCIECQRAIEEEERSAAR
jgi:DnaK suppressor protein